MEEYEITINCQNMPWPQLRKLILFRDRTICQECKNERQRLHIHHLDFNKMNNNPANLITLCPKCHEMYHMGKGIKNNKILFIKKLLMTNSITISGDIAPAVGLSQPSISEFIEKTPASFNKLNNLKKAINLLLQTDYTIEELFTMVDP